MEQGTVTINNPGIITNMIEAFESIGFENDAEVQTETHAELYYSLNEDKNYKIVITKSGNNIVTAIYDSATNAIITTLFSTNNTGAWRLDYIKFGNNILLGVSLVSSSFKVSAGDIEPVSETDEHYLVYGSQYGTIYKYSTRTHHSPVSSPPANCTMCSLTGAIPSSAVQVSKVYDVNRFVDNLYFVTVYPNIGAGVTCRAQIGDKVFLIYKISGFSSSGSNLQVAFDVTDYV